VSINTVRVLSATPGRIRYEVPRLLDDRIAAAMLEQRLAGEPRIKSVNINVLTGRVLILFSGLDPDHITQMLGDAFGSYRASKEEPPAWDGNGSLAAGARLAIAAAMTLLRPITGAFMMGKNLTDMVRSRWNPDQWVAGKTTAGELPAEVYKHPLRSLTKYRPEYAVQVRKAMVTTVANKLLDLAPPLLIAMAIDVASGGAIVAAFGASPIVGLVVLTAATIVIWGFESLTQYRFRKQWEGFAHRLQNDIRMDAYDRVQYAEMSFLEGTTTGAIMKVVNSDVNQIEQFFRDGLDHMVGVAVNLAVAALAYVTIAPLLSLATLIPIPIIIWYSIRYEKKLGPRLDDVRGIAGDINTVLVNNITGMATIRSFTAEELQMHRLRKLSEEYVRTADRATALTSSFTPIIRMAVLAGFAATMLGGGMMVIGGTLPPSLFAFTLLLTQRILWPLTDLGHALDNYERTVVSARRIFKLLEAPVGPPSGEIPLPSEQVGGVVRFEQVSFGYEPDHAVLKGFTAEFPSGETTAIVGVTGSGKSTLVKLLLFFYETNAGRILLDGIDIRELRTEDLRRAIGLVSQDVFLFDGTVFENIAYGRQGASADEIERAAKAAEAHAFIVKLPQGYDTLVGERGLKLSGGQRQRVALARAFLKDPPILILDEATSSVDNETEAAIQRSLQKLSRGRTTIAIAHRLSTVRHANRIVVLGEHGRIVEEGTHDELVALGGYYARLWNIQTGQILISDERPPRDSAVDA